MRAFKGKALRLALLFGGGGLLGLLGLLGLGGIGAISCENHGGTEDQRQAEHEGHEFLHNEGSPFVFLTTCIPDYVTNRIRGKKFSNRRSELAFLIGGGGAGLLGLLGLLGLGGIGAIGCENHGRTED